MNTQSWMSKLICFGLACFTMLVFASFTVEYAHAAPLKRNYVGGVNLEAYYDDKYDAKNFFNYISEGWPVLLDQNAAGWHCHVHTAYVEYSLYDMPNVIENDYLYEVDMSEACYMQYGGPVWAIYTDWNNPYSWQCVN